MRNTMKQVRPEDFDAQAMYDAAREGRLYVVVYEDEMDDAILLALRQREAISALKMDPAQIRSFYLGMQELLYNSRGVVNLTIENHYHGNIDQLTINGN